jgi:hypothetical protein
MSQRDKTRKPNETARTSKFPRLCATEKWNFCAIESLQITRKRNKEKKGKRTTTK